MKVKKIMLMGIFILAILTIGVASAEDASDILTNESGDASVPLGDVEDSHTEVNQEIQDTGHAADIEEDLNEKTDSKDEGELKDLEIALSVPKEIIKTETMEISYNVPNENNVDGKLDIYIDNELDRETYIYAMETGYMNFNLEDRAIGTHTCSIVYSGNDYYKPFNRTFEFEIVNARIHVNEVMYRDSSIRAILPGDATGTFTVIINGSSRQYNVKNVEEDYNGNRVISHELYNLEYGKYDVEAIYSGNYGKITKRMNMTIDMRLSFYTRDASLTYYIQHYNEDFLFFFSPSNVTVLIDGNDIHYDIDHNKPGSISRSENEYDGMIFDKAPIWLNEVSLSQGYHTIELRATSNGYTSSIRDMFYIENSRLADKESQPVNPAYPIELMFGDNTTGNVSFYLKVNNGDFSLINCVNITDNVAKTILNCSESGEYQIKAVLNTNEYTEEITSTLEFVPAILKYKNWYERFQLVNEPSTDVFTLQTCENATGTFSIYINNKLFKAVKINSPITKITVPGTAFNKKVGEYTIKAVWDTNYGKGSKETTPLYIDDYTSLDYCFERGYNKNIPEYGGIVMFYNDKLSFSVRAISENSNPVGKNKIVTFQIGKQKFNVKTNSKGIATLKIPNTIKPGKYTIKASYKGVSKTVKYYKKLTVKQVLALKKVKVKKSAKKLVLTATLKKGKTPIRYKYVKFYFNGKFIKKVKTSKKGVAKVTIKKTVLKKLKVGKTVKYQATYLKGTVKKSAVVKK